MKLFDDIERKDLEPSPRSEPYFSYWNRSARPIFAYMREQTEQWFCNYKADHKKQVELRDAFRSTKEETHLSAFFELYLYTLFKKLGYKIQVEPEWDDGKRPDFLLEDSSGQPMLLEATATYPESEFGTKKKLEDLVLDELDKRVMNRNFFIHINIPESPISNPPFAKIARYLDQEFNKLDVDNLRQQIENFPENSFDILPKINYPDDSWNISFVPIPKSKEMRSKLNIRSVGSISSGGSSFDDATPIRNSIQRKNAHYGKLNIPYILAINVFGVIVDDIDVANALFGDEVIYIGSNKMGRNPNGAWRGTEGWRKTRMSGLLVFKHFWPSTMAKTNPVLWHHPNAQNPINHNNFKLNQKIPDRENNQLIDFKGADAPDLLMLDKDKFVE
jgi:hypothetical protein